MFTIGAFAEHGRVSVRMLRHYDAIGLLRPAHVDPASGYRYYRAEQLTQLNRIVALKELGFSLQLVRSILHDDVSADELRGMLRLRRAELESVLADTAARLAEVEARLRTIESEHLMPTDDVVVKSLPPLRVAELSGTARSFDPREMGPLVSSLYGDLRARLHAAGVVLTGSGITRYEDLPDGIGVVVLAGLPVAAGTGHVEGARLVDLPHIDRAATIVHSGAMDGVLPTVQALARWLDAHGHPFTAQHARELLLAEGVTELQVPLSGAVIGAEGGPPPP